MNHSSQIPVADIEILSGNIFNVTATSGSEITLDCAKRLISATNDLLYPNIPYRGGIYDLTAITYIHADAREYLASGQDVIGKVVGVGLISSSSLGKLMGNIFLKLSRPKDFPMRVFDSPIRAEHWVRSKMDIALSTPEKKAA
ncbi:MAG: hypothetical protein JKX84_09385 [Flavobacteriales bacterium]|nr:hypothetical protein [Flavobacteriales bacterium]